MLVVTAVWPAALQGKQARGIEEVGDAIPDDVAIVGREDRYVGRWIKFSVVNFISPSRMKQPCAWERVERTMKMPDVDGADAYVCVVCCHFEASLRTLSWSISGLRFTAAQVSQIVWCCSLATELPWKPYQWSFHLALWMRGRARRRVLFGNWPKKLGTTLGFFTAVASSTRVRDSHHHRFVLDAFV